jgi:hypothetical protein
MSAFMFLATKRLHRENYVTLSLLLLAQSGDEKAVKRQLEEWEKEGG